MTESAKTFRFIFIKNNQEKSMNIVIASFAIVILAIAILFSQRYEFIGSGENIYKLDNFTGKIEKIEGNYIVKMNQKLNMKKIEVKKEWSPIENKKIKAVLKTEYINDTLFVKLEVQPKIKNYRPDVIKVFLLDKNNFIIKTLTLKKYTRLDGKLVYFTSASIPVSFYSIVNSWLISE